MFASRTLGLIADPGFGHDAAVWLHLAPRKFDSTPPSSLLRPAPMACSGHTSLRSAHTHCDFSHWGGEGGSLVSRICAAGDDAASSCLRLLLAISERAGRDPEQARAMLAGTRMIPALPRQFARRTRLRGQRGPQPRRQPVEGALRGHCTPRGGGVAAGVSMALPLPCSITQRKPRRRAGRSRASACAPERPPPTGGIGCHTSNARASRSAGRTHRGRPGWQHERRSGGTLPREQSRSMIVTLGATGPPEMAPLCDP